MTAGSTGSAQNDATGTTLSGPPGLDVVEQALAMFFDGAGGQAAAEAGAATQAALDAVDTLVVDALDACLADAPDTMDSLTATIAEQHLREGVSRAINMLGAVVAHLRGCLGQPGEDVELTTPDCATYPVEQRLILVHSARLATEFLSAILTRDGLRLATTLKDMQPENFQSVLSILVTHAAGLLDATLDVRAQVEAALGRQLCPTQA